MTILAVDNHCQKLKHLTRCLIQAFPEAQVVPFTDPLLAVQYSSRRPVDMLFASVHMRGLSGPRLSDGVRRFSADARIFLLAGEDGTAHRTDGAVRWPRGRRDILDIVSASAEPLQAASQLE